MLTLRRKANESIVCIASNGERIEFILHEVNAVNVVVNVHAPREVKILRGEIEHKPERVK